MFATVAALVVDKAVITANAMAFLRIFDRAPLIQPIFSRPQYIGSRHSLTIDGAIYAFLGY